MLRRSLTMVVVLVDSCRPRILWLLSDVGEGIVLIGGSDGDLKRMEG